MKNAYYWNLVKTYNAEGQKGWKRTAANSSRIRRIVKYMERTVGGEKNPR
jgi:hypothetical protein